MTSEFDYTEEFISYQAAKLAIANFCSVKGHRFSQNKSTGKFNKCSTPQPTAKPHVSTSSRQYGLAPIDGSLFITIGTQQLVCKYSSKRNPCKRKEPPDSKDGHHCGSKKTRRRVKPVDYKCKARIVIREALCFQFDKGVKNLEKRIQHFKRTILDSIKNGDLSALYERRFIVVFPEESYHTKHPIGKIMSKLTYTI